MTTEQGLIQDFFARNSILGQDVGICIVYFGLLVVFVFWYFHIVPNTH